MKSSAKIAIAAVAVFVVLQFVRPGIPSKPATAELEAPPQIHQILQRDCYRCHSDQPRLAWFDEIVPGYWMVRDDIRSARAHLNFSTLGSKPAAAQKATLHEAVNMIQLGAMPLPRFLALHPAAKVSADDLAALKAYLAPWAPLPLTGVSQPPGAATPAIRLDSVTAEWNGVAFDASFESWRPLSFTDRGDNNTLRFVLGNDIAIQAAELGRISPWPDGTRFAKIAWQQQVGSDGLVYPGEFVQVELMIKDAKKYASTEGWGWGRWRGLVLKPYGAGARFARECTGCHQPLKGDDYVYTLPITGATSTPAQDVNNRAAALPASLPYQPLRWAPITLFVDPRTRTMATLYGNDAAVKSVQARSAVPAAPPYEQGSVLALVTWAQRDDPHWFGAKIPDSPAWVEFVSVGPKNASSYRRFDGPNFAEAIPAANSVAQRTAFLLGLKPASLP